MKVFSALLVCFLVAHTAANSASVSKDTDEVINALCESASITSCKQCILAHPQCAWCAVNSPGASVTRCKSIKKFHKDNDCEQGLLNFPPNDIRYTKDKEFSIIGQVRPEDKAVQLKPQKIDLKLRKGKTEKFNVTYRKVRDYKVDLYYVMDLSYSMGDDLKTLQNLGKSLANNITSITKDIRLGFGTFVDKVMMPFASTVEEQLQNPCVKNEDSATCAPPFGFKHQQSISDNLDGFKQVVETTQISGNIDSPEGGFDALMQIAVCKREIGWRDDATHLIVFTTDASFHMALDGKLAAIFDANDMQCHLSRGANKYIKDAIVYDKSKEMDYPSIGQLRSAFVRNKIQPIFAVTDDVFELYDGLRSLIPNTYVDKLAADSSNIIKIIEKAYNDLKGKLEMNLDPPPPNHLTVKTRVLCPLATEFNEVGNLKCENIQIGSEAVYEFEITSNYDCNEVETSPTIFNFSSSSLQEDVQIKINYICDCECAREIIPSHKDCSSNGSLVCGVCKCDPGHEGIKCQCHNTKQKHSLTENCKKSGVGGTGEICEGHGKCECGVCQCDPGYYGTFCQCSNLNCAQNADGLCGGADKGTCENCDGIAKCNCKNNYTLEEDGIKTCSCHTKLCRKNQDMSNTICSGNGDCDCNVCKCHNDSTVWTDTYCDKCIHPSCKAIRPECNGLEMRACASCIHKAQRERLSFAKECGTVCNNIEYNTAVTIPDCATCTTNECNQICNVVDIKQTFPQCTTPLAKSDCDIKYKVMWNKNTNDYYLVVQQFDKERDCPKPVNPLLYVLPIIAGIVLLGLAALIAWKIYQTIRDKKEWENFEKEMKQSRWTKGQNPIFQKPFSRFQNPMYQGH